jgi:hypothetical protein
MHQKTFTSIDFQAHDKQRGVSASARGGGRRPVAGTVQPDRASGLGKGITNVCCSAHAISFEKGLAE